MTAELVLRFVLGDAIVSAFAVVGELFRPKTFAGLFGAAPSVAIATLAIAYVDEGGEYVTTEAPSMLAGCAALLVYGAACVATTKQARIPVWLGAGLALALVQPLHGLTFALLHLACMRVIAAVVPPHLAATAQAIYAVGATATSALMSVVAGALYGRAGAAGFLVMALVCASALPVAVGLGRGTGSALRSP